MTIELEDKTGPARSGILRTWNAICGSKAVLFAAGFLLLISIAALFGPAFAFHDPNLVDLSLRNHPPMTPASDGGLPYFLGTDPLGRDSLGRIVLGARVTLAVALASVVLSGFVGVAIGLVTGFYRGKVEEIVMRLVDVQMSFPSLLIALLVLYVLGGSFLNVILILAILRWVEYARFTRGLVVTFRERLFVEAAQVVGASTGRIIFRHILPNILGPVFVLAILEVATVILMESSLSFLGLGVQPPEVSWGQMIATARPFIRNAWWLTAFPGLAIFLTAISLHICSTWIRERSL